jgi:hypothetical protein
MPLCNPANNERPSEYHRNRVLFPVRRALELSMLLACAPNAVRRPLQFSAQTLSVRISLA